MVDVHRSAPVVRNQRRLPGVESVMRDAWYALRGFRRSPGFTAAALVCLALGIGATTTIFSLVNATMIRRLPVSRPDQLILFRWTSDGRKTVLPESSSGMGDRSLPYAALRAFSTRVRTLSGAVAFVPLGFDRASVTVRAGAQTIVASGEMVSGSYFGVLGVGARLGRPLVESDAVAGAPNAVVLSHAFWRRDFAGDAGAIGRAVTLNGQPFTIVGVAPPQFRGLDPSAAPDLWVPLRDVAGLRPWGLPPSSAGPSLFENTGYFWCTMAGRLRPGVTVEQALREIDPLFRQTITEGMTPAPASSELPRLVIEPGANGLDLLRDKLATPLRILGAGVLLLLFIACANVATLLLARSESRQKEIGVRLAIGASRGRVVQQLLVEGIVLAACGGALGLVVAWWGGPILLQLLARADSAPALDAHLDLTALAFSTAVSMLTGIAFALVPAIRATRFDVASRLGRASRAVSPRRRLGRALVAGQAALAVLLLVGAGLFVRTLRNLEGQDLGFDSGNLLLFQLDAGRAGYRGERGLAIYRQALDRIGQLPGVTAATASATALLSGWNSTSPTSTDGAGAATGRPTQAYWNAVGPDFLDTLRIPVVSGRGIGQREAWSGQRVAVVNRAWARAAFPGENPIGHRLCMNSRFDAARSYEIIGVVEDAKYDRLRREPPPTIYLPFAVSGNAASRLWFEVRTAGSPRALVGPIREAIGSIDSALALLNVRTEREQIDLSLAQERMVASTASAFGALALLLVGTGLFGTLAYAVSRRTSEIGIRIALGAGAWSVAGMILREALGLVAVGVAIGLPAALAAARLVRTVLFGVTPHDGATIAVTVGLLATVGVAAGLLPAMRAARIEPTKALGME